LETNASKNKPLVLETCSCLNSTDSDGVVTTVELI